MVMWYEERGRKLGARVALYTVCDVDVEVDAGEADKGCDVSITRRQANWPIVSRQWQSVDEGGEASVQQYD